MTTAQIPPDMTAPRIQALRDIEAGYHMRVHPAREESLVARGYAKRIPLYDGATKTAPMITEAGRALLAQVDQEAE